MGRSSGVEEALPEWPFRIVGILQHEAPPSLSSNAEDLRVLGMVRPARVGRRWQLEINSNDNKLLSGFYYLMVCCAMEARGAGAQARQYDAGVRYSVRTITSLAIERAVNELDSGFVAQRGSLGEAGGEGGIIAAVWVRVFADVENGNILIMA